MNEVNKEGWDMLWIHYITEMIIFINYCNTRKFSWESCKAKTICFGGNIQN